MQADMLPYTSAAQELLEPKSGGKAQQMSWLPNVNAFTSHLFALESF